MSRAATPTELGYFRSERQWTELKAYIRAPSTIYTAQVDGTPASTDMVTEITYDNGSGVLGDVKVNMAILVGSTAGAHDLGMVRVRKTPGAATFYVGEMSEVDLVDDAHLTVINDTMGIWPRHLKIISLVPYMDADIAYSDQFTDFDPVPIVGTDRVVYLTGATVDVVFDASDSWVYDSSITGYLWEAPGSSSTSGLSTATPTIAYNAEGQYQVYCTVTAATGKTTVRCLTVFVDAGTLATDVLIKSPPKGSLSDGGWRCVLKTTEDISSIIPFTKVVLAGREYYGGTQANVGPVVGSENIEMIGWITEEEIELNPEQDQVFFRISGANYMLDRISEFIASVEFNASASDAWTNIYQMTIDKGLWHLLHWRSTVTQNIDIFLTDDTRYVPRVVGPEGSFWEVLRTIAATTIFANVACNSLSQLFVKIDPQLVPSASRTWPTVMTLGDGDWINTIESDAETSTPVGKVFLEGVAIDAFGSGSAFFSLAPGHVMRRFGSVEAVSNLLLSSQAQSNQLAALYLAWRNNRHKDVSIQLYGKNKLIDIMPPMFLNASFTDSLHGDSIAGNFIPRTVARPYDSRTGRMRTSVSAELETDEDDAVSIDGDVPGSGDVPDNYPSLPARLPPLLPVGIIPLVPSLPESEGDVSVGPRKVLIATSNFGIMYSENFNEVSPTWAFMNSGLSTDEYNEVQDMVVTPSGAIFAMVEHVSLGSAKSLYYSPALGAPWNLVYEASARMIALGFNPDDTEEIMIVDGIVGNMQVRVGDRDGVTQEATGLDSERRRGKIIHIGSKWILVHAKDDIFSRQAWSRFAAAGTIEANSNLHAFGQTYSASRHHACGGGGNVYSWNQDTLYLRTIIDGDGTTSTTVKHDLGALGTNPMQMLACSPNGKYLMGGIAAKLGWRSTDYGATWGSVTALLGVGYDSWFNCESEDAFITGTTQVIKYTGDFGDTFIDKSGNLATIAPLSDLTFILHYGW